MTDIDTDPIISDSAAGIGTTFRHLADRGHRRIAYIGDSERIPTGRVRAETMRACLREAGVPGVSGLVRTNEIDRSSIAAAVEALLGSPDPPSALITGNILTTRHALTCRAGAGTRWR
jgi:LacI family transcriptional regulator